MHLWQLPPLAFAAVPSAAPAQQPSYAEDRALIENMSNHYMVAVDAAISRPSWTPGRKDGVLELGSAGSSTARPRSARP
jgi:hypothetical protein